MSIAINGHQLRHALDFIDGDDESMLEFEHLDERKDAETGEIMPAGLYCWYTEYPEEGVLHLPEAPCTPISEFSAGDKHGL